MRGDILPSKAAIFSSPALHKFTLQDIAALLHGSRYNGDAAVEAGEKKNFFGSFFIDSDGEGGAKEGKIAARLSKHRFIDEAF